MRILCPGVLQSATWSSSSSSCAVLALAACAVRSQCRSRLACRARGSCCNAVIAGVPFSVMGLYHVIPFHAEIWHLLLLMGLTFMFSVAYGNWRYR